MLLPIPADSPFFAGHFPGHPVFPGIAQLALVAQALGGVSILEIPALRLRSPVRPGDVLAAKIDGPADGGTVRFEMRRDDEAVSNGTLRVGSSGETPDLPEVQEAPAGPFPPIATLLPHAPPARLVRSVLEASPEGLIGVAEIPGASPFAVEGRAPAFVGLEAAAQGAAVLETLGRQDAPGPRIGYLVAIRGARCSVPILPVERPFRFAVRLTGSAPPLSIYEVTVEGTGGTELLRGTVSTYIPLES